MTDEQIFATAKATGMTLFGLGLDKAKFEFCLLAFAKQITKLEREACAKVCEEIAQESDAFTESILRATATQIRARGEA